MIWGGGEIKKKNFEGPSPGKKNYPDHHTCFFKTFSYIYFRYYMKGKTPLTSPTSDVPFQKGIKEAWSPDTTNINRGKYNSILIGPKSSFCL